MTDLEIRKMISTMLEPVFESQKRLQNLVVVDMGSKMHAIGDRVYELEECLYRKESKEDRFTKLEDKIQIFQVDCG